ncbi:MAG: Holliday junction branch migration protein RuvA, partial [Rhodobacterales bacterium]
EDLGEVIETAAPQVSRPRSAPAPRAAPSAQAEALSALSNLGYGPGDAAGAVAQAAGDMPDAATPDLIRAALKLLAPKS